MCSNTQSFKATRATPASQLQAFLSSNNTNNTMTSFEATWAAVEALNLTDPLKELGSYLRVSCEWLATVATSSWGFKKRLVSPRPAPPLYLLFYSR